MWALLKHPVPAFVVGAISLVVGTVALLATDPDAVAANGPKWLAALSRLAAAAVGGMPAVVVAVGVGLLCVGVVLIGIATVQLVLPVAARLRRGRDRVPPEIRREAARLSRDVLAFLSDRQRASPPLVPPVPAVPPSRASRVVREQYNAALRAYQDALAQHSLETTALYHERFGADVVRLYEEFKARGYQEPATDRVRGYLYPGNQPGIAAVAQRLGAWANTITPTAHPETPP